MNIGIENETLEFKKTTGELKEGIISLSSMINKHNFGTLYFGVNNKGEVVGQDVSEKTLRDVSKGIAENIKPQIFPIVEKVLIDNKDLIKVEVNGDETPYSAYGKYYIRTADEDRELSFSELKRIINEENSNDLFERKITEYKLDDLDNDAINKFKYNAIKAKRIPDENYDNIDLIKKLGLIEGEYLNNAGALLFSKKEPLAVKMAVFATDEKITFLDQKIVEGNIINLLDVAEKYIYEHLNWKVEITSGPREEIPEIPIACIRELISNFFAHSVYNTRSYHEIDIHPTFISIYNPGTFASKFKPEDYVSDKLGSFIRNKLIAKALYLYNRIEQFGSGLNRVISLLEDNSIKYEFNNSDSGFKVVLYRNNNTIVSNKKELNLSKIEEIVLQIIKKNNYITTLEIANEIGKTQRTVMTIVKKLSNAGIIERVGSRKTGHWKVII